jgi:hypothetical protein
VVTIAAGFAAVPSPSAAQPAAGKSALERFDDAQKLFDHGKHEDALALFRQVYGETKSPNARLMAARCLLALGRTADGYDELAATVREAAGRAESEPKYARTRDAAAAELGALEPKIGKIVVALADPAATVSLNGATLAPERLGVPLATLPGRVVLLAKKPDGTTVQREETVGAGQTKTITLVFPSAPPAATAPAPPEPPPPAIPREPPPTVKIGGGVRVAGIVIATLGAAGMGVFGATYAVAQSKYNSLVSGCGGARCTDPKYDAVIDSGKQMEVVSNVSVVAGGVALGAGALMIILGGPSAKPRPATGAWSGPSLALSPYGARVGYEGAF